MIAHRIAVKIAFFVNGFVYATWVSRLPRIQDMYHADNGTIGFVLLAASIGAVGAMPFTGWIILRNGSRRVTIFSTLVYCLLILLIPYMQTVPLLIALYFAMGIASGILDVSMNAQAVMVEQLYRKPIMTSFHALFSIGMALGAWSGALFADLETELFHHFLTVVSISLIISIWMSRNLLDDIPQPAHDGPLFRWPTAGLVSIGVIAFCCMLAEGAMADWSVNYMENIVKASKTTAPIALSAFATAMTLGRIFGDYFRRRIGDRKLIIGGGVISLMGLSAALLYPEEYVVITGFFLVGAGLSVIVPIAYSIAGNTKEVPAGVGLAMVTTVGYTGFMVGPPLIGFIADWQSLRTGLLVVAILLCMMTVLGLRFRTRV